MIYVILFIAAWLLGAGTFLLTPHGYLDFIELGKIVIISGAYALALTRAIYLLSEDRITRQWACGAILVLVLYPCWVIFAPLIPDFLILIQSFK